MELVSNKALQRKALTRFGRRHPGLLEGIFPGRRCGRRFGLLLKQLLLLLRRDGRRRAVHVIGAGRGELRHRRRHPVDRGVLGRHAVDALGNQICLQLGGQFVGLAVRVIDRGRLQPRRRWRRRSLQHWLGAEQAGWGMSGDYCEHSTYRRQISLNIRDADRKLLGLLRPHGLLIIGLDLLGQSAGQADAARPVLHLGDAVGQEEVGPVVRLVLGVQLEEWQLTVRSLVEVPQPERGGGRIDAMTSGTSFRRCGRKTAEPQLVSLKMPPQGLDRTKWVASGLLVVLSALVGLRLSNSESPALTIGLSVADENGVAPADICFPEKRPEAAEHGGPKGGVCRVSWVHLIDQAGLGDVGELRQLEAPADGRQVSTEATGCHAALSQASHILDQATVEAEKEILRPASRSKARGRIRQDLEGAWNASDSVCRSRLTSLHGELSLFSAPTAAELSLYTTMSAPAKRPGAAKDAEDRRDGLLNVDVGRSKTATSVVLPVDVEPVGFIGLPNNAGTTRVAGVSLDDDPSSVARPDGRAANGLKASPPPVQQLSERADGSSAFPGHAAHPGQLAADPLKVALADGTASMQAAPKCVFECTELGRWDAQHPRLCVNQDAQENRAPRRPARLLFVDGETEARRQAPQALVSLDTGLVGAPGHREVVEVANAATTGVELEADGRSLDHRNLPVHARTGMLWNLLRGDEVPCHQRETRSRPVLHARLLLSSKCVVEPHDPGGVVTCLDQLTDLHIVLQVLPNAFQVELSPRDQGVEDARVADYPLTDSCSDSGSSLVSNPGPLSILGIFMSLLQSEGSLRSCWSTSPGLNRPSSCWRIAAVSDSRLAIFRRSSTRSSASPASSRCCCCCRRPSLSVSAEFDAACSRRLAASLWFIAVESLLTSQIRLSLRESKVRRFLVPTASGVEVLLAARASVQGQAQVVHSGWTAMLCRFQKPLERELVILPDQLYTKGQITKLRFEGQASSLRTRDTVDSQQCFGGLRNSCFKITLSSPLTHLGRSLHGDLARHSGESHEPAYSAGLHEDAGEAVRAAVAGSGAFDMIGLFAISLRCIRDRAFVETEICSRHLRCRASSFPQFAHRQLLDLAEEAELESSGSCKMIFINFFGGKTLQVLQCQESAWKALISSSFKQLCRLECVLRLDENFLLHFNGRNKSNFSSAKTSSEMALKDGTDEKKPASKSIIDVICASAAETSTHGLSRLVGNRPVYVKLTWLVLFLAMATIFSLQARGFILKLLQLPETTTIQEDSIGMVFPDLYICPQPIISGSYGNFIDNATALLVNSYIDGIARTFNFTPKNDGDAETFIRILLSTMPYKLLSDTFGHQAQQTLYNDIFSDEVEQEVSINKTGSLIRFHSPALLNCIFINLTKERRNFMKDSWNFFTLYLFYDSAINGTYPTNELLKSVPYANISGGVKFPIWDIQSGMAYRSGASMRLSLVAPGHYPTDNAAHIYLEPGRDYQVLTDMSLEIMKDGIPCTEKPPKVSVIDPYSMQADLYEYNDDFCWIEFKERLRFRNASCIDNAAPWLAEFSNLSRCFDASEYLGRGASSEKRAAFLQTSRAMRGGNFPYDLNHVQSVCNRRRPCSKLIYNARAYSSKWPTFNGIQDTVLHRIFLRIAQEKMLAMRDLPFPAYTILAAMFTAIESNVTAAGKAMLESYASRVITKVTIRTGKIMGPTVIMSRSYSFLEFVSDVGGILGLFLGCSLLTLFELLELLYNLIDIGLRGSCAARTADQRQETWSTTTSVGSLAADSIGQDCSSSADSKWQFVKQMPSSSEKSAVFCFLLVRTATGIVPGVLNILEELWIYPSQLLEPVGLRQSVGASQEALSLSGVNHGQTAAGFGLAQSAEVFAGAACLQELLQKLTQQAPLRLWWQQRRSSIAPRNAELNRLVFAAVATALAANALTHGHNDPRYSLAQRSSLEPHLTDRGSSSDEQRRIDFSSREVLRRSFSQSAMAVTCCRWRLPCCSWYACSSRLFTDCGLPGATHSVTPSHNQRRVRVFGLVWRTRLVDDLLDQVEILLEISPVAHQLRVLADLAEPLGRHGLHGAAHQRVVIQHGQEVLPLQRVQVAVGLGSDAGHAAGVVHLRPDGALLDDEVARLENFVFKPGDDLGDEVLVSVETLRRIEALDEGGGVAHEQRCASSSIKQTRFTTRMNTDATFSSCKWGSILCRASCPRQVRTDLNNNNNMNSQVLTRMHELADIVPLVEHQEDVVHGDGGDQVQEEPRLEVVLGDHLGIQDDFLGKVVITGNSLRSIQLLGVIDQLEPVRYPLACAEVDSNVAEEDGVRDAVEDDPVGAQVVIEEGDGHGQDHQRVLVAEQFHCQLVVRRLEEGEELLLQVAGCALLLLLVGPHVHRAGVRALPGRAAFSIGLQRSNQRLAGSASQRVMLPLPRPKPLEEVAGRTAGQPPPLFGPGRRPIECRRSDKPRSSSTGKQNDSLRFNRGERLPPSGSGGRSCGLPAPWRNAFGATHMQRWSSAVSGGFQSRGGGPPKKQLKSAAPAASIPMIPSDPAADLRPSPEHSDEGQLSSLQLLRPASGWCCSIFYLPPHFEFGSPDIEGEDVEGEDVEGEDVEGEDVEGEDVEGKDAEGEDVEGEDVEGEEVEGKDMEGKDVEGKEVEGEDVEGKDMELSNTAGGTSSSRHRLSLFFDIFCQLLVQPPQRGRPGPVDTPNFVTRQAVQLVAELSMGCAHSRPRKQSRSKAKQTRRSQRPAIPWNFRRRSIEPDGCREAQSGGSSGHRSWASLHQVSSHQLLQCRVDRAAQQQRLYDFGTAWMTDCSTENCMHAMCTSRERIRNAFDDFGASEQQLNLDALDRLDFGSSPTDRCCSGCGWDAELDCSASFYLNIDEAAMF
uniref:ATP-dependent DNA helicase n=2 Tax=Macrostomum lignano TaxID=282301 RepID=A0A1I8HKC4_9PLAT